MIVIPAIAWTVWGRRPRPRPWTLFVLALVATAPVATVITGALVGMMVVMPMRGGEDVSPSDKSRLLAKTISETMNGAVYAVLGAAIVAVGVGAMALVRRRRAPP
jgi:hypothetical protein